MIMQNCGMWEEVTSRFASDCRRFRRRQKLWDQRAGTGRTLRAAAVSAHFLLRGFRGRWIWLRWIVVVFIVGVISPGDAIPRLVVV
jgi:uncharacterized membrane protein YkvA (DUF1232 family)